MLKNFLRVKETARLGSLFRVGRALSTSNKENSDPQQPPNVNSEPEPEKKEEEKKTAWERFSFLNEVQNFRREWRENALANQPMPDPEGVEYRNQFWDFVSLPLSKHILVLRETAALYKNSLFDPAEAIRNIKIDQEVMRIRDEERMARKAAEAAEAAEAAAAALNASLSEEERALLLQQQKQQQQQQEQQQARQLSDVEELVEKVAKLFPKDVKDVKNIDDAVRVAAARSEDVKEVAADRLEVMGMAITEFMNGYREGKEKALEESKHNKSETDFSSFMEAFVKDRTNAVRGNTETDEKSDDDVPKEKEKKEEEEKEKKPRDGP